MAKNANLKNSVAQVVKTNGVKGITGANLQPTILQVIDKLGGGYQFGGLVEPNGTFPVDVNGDSLTDQNFAFLASTPGTYTNFGGLVVNEGEVCVLIWDGTWTKQVTEITTKMELNQLGQVVDDLDEAVMKETTVENTYTFSNAGVRYTADGTCIADVGSNRGVVIIPVVPGANYKITTYLRSIVIPGVIYTSDQSVTIGQNLSTVLGTEYPGTGSDQTIISQPLTIPAGTTFVIAQTANILNLPQNSGVFETVSLKVSNVYTKEEADEKFAPITSNANKVYGVKWDITDPDDLGERCFDAVGMMAQIGIGTTDGHSDFDNILPWSGMKRCNIKANANGAKIVTFEGDAGFALDGSNGDVFVRIPKFKTSRYIENGKMYVTIGDGYVHPAFIENGVELDEIFVGAFEASFADNALYSKGGVIPANNLTNVQFLAAAKARGNNYTLFDMRAIDAIWRLMAVEYGKRNSNRILGWGYADYMQPDNSISLRVTLDATQTNSVQIGIADSNTSRLTKLNLFHAGGNITICENSQTNIIAQRKITNVICEAVGDNVVITFDGTPLDVNTNMFVGNAPCDTNYCETLGDSYKLNWHTGRANWQPISGVGAVAETMNPCRYRWIENPIGNVWHNLPDVRFNALQMYVCQNMLQYSFGEFTNYEAIGDILPEQNNNGIKSDVNTVENPNFWITALMNDVFSKGNGFAKSFDTVHDGTLTAQKGYGGYYYLSNGNNINIVHGGGYDHLWRCNMLTFRAWQGPSDKWYLYGARLMFKNI